MLLLPRRLAPALAASALLVGLAGGCTGDSGDSGRSAAPDAAPEATPEATIASTREVSARVVDLVVDSPALDTVATVRLLLPRGFRAARTAEPAREWPLLLLLHGAGGDHTAWTTQADVERTTGRSQVIVAMPDGGVNGLYSDWQDGPQWETFHTGELPDLLEEEYAANGTVAVAGLSMGGLGAIGYAARHPDQFEAAASFSGIADTLLNAERPTNYLRLAGAQGDDPLALWGDPVEDRDVWEEHNPTDLADELVDIPVFVSSGNGRPGPLDGNRSGVDLLELALWQENRSFRRALEEAGVEATYDFYGPGTHSWPYWERSLRRAWPLLEGALTG